MSEMESWSWPPRYDDSYRPPANSRYWFPKRETMPQGERERAIVQRLREVCGYAYEKSTFYRAKWDEAGFTPDQVKSLEDFESKCPVSAKVDLRKAQERPPPFGDYLCIPDAEIFHIHGTSGTTGRPTAFGISEADWKNIANAHARIMWGFGIRPGDMVFIAAILSLYLGSWGALAGAERMGCKSFPSGPGPPGMTPPPVHCLTPINPQARNARLHPPRADLAADDPAGLGRPHAMDQRAEPLRAHLSAAAQRNLRPHRRHVHHPGRERLPERNRRSPQQGEGLRRRAPHRHQPRGSDGRVDDPGRAHAGGGEAGRGHSLDVQGDGGEEHPHHARDPRRRGGGRLRHVPAHRLQGPPRDRRPRGLPRDEPEAGRGGQAVSRFVTSRDLLPRVLKGEVAAVARLLSRAEAADPECRETLGQVYALAGKAHVIGITGVPGSGKSTLVSV